MGYRSTIVIGIHKEVLARHLIAPEIPPALQAEEYKLKGDYAYWCLEGWKWYSTYPDVAAIQAYFAQLSEENEEAEATDKPPVFGAIRLGEVEDDKEHWGSPNDLDIYIQTTIDFPQGD